MSLQAANKIIQDFEDALKQASKNTTCLYPGCSNKPIGSHVIARKTLKLIAEDSLVLTWLPRKVSAWNMARAVDMRMPLEKLSEEPVLVGIRDFNKVTSPLFCHDHDDMVFAPLEKEEFSFQPEQVALLAYRALCFMTFSAPPTEALLRVARQHGYQHSLDTPERLQRLERFHARKVSLESRKRYEQIHLAQDYGQLGWSIFPVSLPPCIAASYSFIPSDESDIYAAVEGTLTLTAEDSISFSILPYTLLNNSICVISWLIGSRRAQKFMYLNKFNQLSESELEDVLLPFVFESQIKYISPTWWQSLSEENRRKLKAVQLNAGREHAHLI